MARASEGSSKKPPVAKGPTRGNNGSAVTRNVKTASDPMWARGRVPAAPKSTAGNPLSFLSQATGSHSAIPEGYAGDWGGSASSAADGGGSWGGGAPAQQQPDMRTLMQQLTGSINSQADAQFGPQFQMLQQQLQAVRDNATRGKQAAGDAYGALQRDAPKNAAAVDALFGGAKAATQKNYGDLQASINQTFDKGQADSLAEMQRLGIQQAAPGNQAQSEQAQALLSSLAATNGQNATDAEGLLGTALHQSALDRGDIAKQSGVNAQSAIDMLSQQQEGQINMKGLDLESQRQALISQLGAAQAKAQADAQQQEFENNLAMQKLNVDKAANYKGVGGAEMLLNDFYDDPAKSQNIIGLLEKFAGDHVGNSGQQVIAPKTMNDQGQLVDNPMYARVKTGWTNGALDKNKMDPNTARSMDPNALMEQLQGFLNQNGLQGQDRANAISAFYAMMGKY